LDGGKGRLASLASRYNLGYTATVKTAISIPEELFESAEQFARGRGMSRSELYATALRHYLEEHRGKMITARLDKIYGEERNCLDPDIVNLQARSLPEDDW
jgi:metal-responsive CopG/Arc/MetJ family transcriptional regulator